MIVPDRLVLLVWSAALLVPWSALYLRSGQRRRPMLWSSLFALPFGFSEVLFAGSYWRPPTLFDLASRVHLDIESFVFLFAAGGLAAVMYDAVSGRTVGVHDGPEKHEGLRELYNAALAAPALVFFPALVVIREPICAGVLAMAAGVLARVACRPDLAPKTLVGGVLFLTVYVALLASLELLEPGYIARYWVHRGAFHARVAGVPCSEILFGAAFGAYWSGLYEHYHWTFAWRRQPPSASAHRGSCPGQ